MAGASGSIGGNPRWVEVMDPRGLVILLVIVVVCLVGMGWVGHDIWNWVHGQVAVSWK